MTEWDDPQNGETRRLPRQQPQYGQQPSQYGQQPQYGQPPYGQQPPQYGQHTDPATQRSRFNDSTANPFGAASDSAFGIVSTVLALLGGILGIVTLTGLDWFTNGVSFSDVNASLDAAGDGANGFAAAYFSWLAWAFLIVGVLAAVMASFPSPALRAFRVLGVVVGFAAAGLSFLALQLTDSSSYVDTLKHTRIGFYLAVIAFLLTGIGAAIGPRKV